jgi:hypothetical protein
MFKSKKETINKYEIFVSDILGVIYNVESILASGKNEDGYLFERYIDHNIDTKILSAVLNKGIEIGKTKINENNKSLIVSFNNKEKKK